MAFDPLTAITSIIQTGLDKFLPDKMSEAEKVKLQSEMTMFVMSQASGEDNKFREFVLAYEGDAAALPKPLLYLRSMIRPAFTILVGYLDFVYFTAASPWTGERGDLLKAVNMIILLFWFGERAITNSGILDILKKRVEK
ncbi:hypothetical protein SAMN04489760_1489 [Syntrophus gentianae]|uniref:Holin of 3TMs, for gene-transfer release n=1 Tax=Syntrophus gentianae TaxID=43775 RepID=A0A1H8B7P4_9BACT|nr:hypothetical protein [Syntrophus gentianae]SEM78971.1 hypothetical protein SAMN04489760_1489 [Syntrophus gentianae]